MSSVLATQRRPSQRRSGWRSPSICRAAGKGGVAYGPHVGVCFETQHWPDGVNQPHFPSALLEPGRMYSHHWNLAFDAGG